MDEEEHDCLKVDGSDYESEIYYKHIYIVTVQKACVGISRLLNSKIINGKTALIISIERQDIETLRLFLALGADPNMLMFPCNVSTALTLAIQKNDTSSVKELVRHGAHFSGEKGIEALEWVVSKCLFTDLIEGENKIFVGDNSEKHIKTAIGVAFESGRQSLLIKLMNCGLSLERTLLLDSTLHQPDLVKLLIDYGVNVNAASTSLNTVLHKCAQSNNIESIKLLIQANSNINAVNRDGETALHRAACVVYSEQSHEPEVEKIEKSRNLEIIRLLIEAKGNVDAKDHEGDTVLHKAVQYGKTEMVKFLIEAKADTNAINGNGETALYRAVDVGSTEIVKLLIGVSSDVNATNEDGDTVLHKAALRNNIDIIELLVKAKVNIGAVNNNGETALHVSSASAESDPASFCLNCTDFINIGLESGTTEKQRSAEYGPCAIVQYLIKAGGDINLEDRYGNTPLTIAVTNNNLMLAHILINGGGDVNKLYSIPSTCVQQTSHCHLRERYMQTPDQSLLWVALYRKFHSTEMAKLLIQHGANINVSNVDRTTVLMLAVDQLDVKWVEDLIGAGADVNATDNFGDSVLIRAVRLVIQEIQNQKHTSTIERSKSLLHLLLKAGCSINSQNFPNPMVLAVNGCHKDCVKLLLEYGGDVNAHDEDLNTLTMLAIRNNSLDIVEVLIASGAVVNPRNKFGDLALHYAAKCKNSQIMQIVLEKFVDSNGKEMTKLGSKRRKCTHEKIFNLDMLNNRSETPLYKAAAYGRWKNVKLLLEHGASTNIHSDNGNTALMRALKHGFENVAKTLLAAEADVNIRNKRGENALLIAAKSGCTEMVKLLIQARADPLSSTNMGNTGLSLAANKDIAELFVQAGADVNLRNVHGQTPLHCAVKKSKTDVFKLLLAHGANVNMKDFYGNTPLIIADHVLQSDIILSLIRAKADVNIQNKKGKTALMYATNFTDAIFCRRYHLNIDGINVRDTLLKSGADVNLKDNTGRSALMYNWQEEEECHGDYNKLLEYGADLEAEDYHGRTVLVQVLLTDGMAFKAAILLNMGANPVLKAEYRHILMKPSVCCYMSDVRNVFLRLLVCNGVVNMVFFNSYFPILIDSCVELCLWYGGYALLRYILANCYISNKDLSYIMLRHNGAAMYASAEELSPDHKKANALLQRAACQPWPLVKLAFIAVSTMMGESPEREDHIRNSQLPNPLKDMLMFETNVARTTVEEWSVLPVCFEA
ncbi:unnamed protein product [Lymnaea stagnalis]|uniref:Uncharacterized protein n=1 Tax=Lymnaea stagnalis TaxID=6523 RepID=A0AAV2HYU0_LYMST